MFKILFVLFERFPTKEKSNISVSKQSVFKTSLRSGTQKVALSLSFVKGKRQKKSEEAICVDDDQYKKYMKQCMKYPIVERKIVFRAYANCADHEKYITEDLIKQKDELDIVWLVSDVHTMVLQGGVWYIQGIENRLSMKW